MKTQLRIKLAKSFAGQSELRLDWPERFGPDVLMISSQGDAVFDLMSYHGSVIYYEPREQESLKLEPGVHAVQATNWNAGNVYYIVHSG